MPRNIEIKARARDFARQSRLAERFAGPPVRLLAQTDTFFARRSARVKLREQEPGGAELIFYRRSDRPGPKGSLYRVLPQADPDGLKARLADRAGILGVVRKERRLYLSGRTRIHFDRVDGLGDFIELEVALGAGEDEQAGRDVARGLMARLDIRPAELVAGAYLDLLLAQRPRP